MSSVFSPFEVIEFRRYTIRDGERQHFAEYFDAYFPEAIQQLGAIAAGQFLERGNPHVFTWIRAFHTMEDRAKANANLYYGPVWKEHRTTMNNLMTDSDNVLLLRPIPNHPLAVLPAVDPVCVKNGAQGVVVAQIFAVKSEALDAFIHQAETAFAKYRAAGVRDAGVLVSLDAPNNFPQLPVRTDGPFLLWLGVVQDNGMLEHKFEPLAKEVVQTLGATGLLRGAPETVVVDPTRRSRMRWLTERQ